MPEKTKQDQTFTETAEEKEDQTSEETAEKEETKEEEKETPEKTEEPEVDYESKFKESQKEAIKLRKELEAKETQTEPPAEPPEDEKKIREVLDKREREKIEQTRLEDEELKKDLDDLHEVHGEFDDNKLINIVERYGVYDNENNVQWERAMELYERLEGEAEPPKKTPSSARTSDKVSEEVVPSEEVQKKSFSELVDEGLKKFGIKR